MSAEIKNKIKWARVTEQSLCKFHGGTNHSNLRTTTVFLMPNAVLSSYQAFYKYFVSE